MNSTPARPMLAREDVNGTPVPGTAVCVACARDEEVAERSRVAWEEPGVGARGADDALVMCEDDAVRCMECGAVASVGV